MTTIVWGWAGRALEVVSGDRHVVIPFSGGALVALVDALGHGHLAAEVAMSAESALRANPEAPVLSLFQQCHDALRKTRGAVMSVASFDAPRSSMTWAGVGNVAGVLLRVEPTPERLDQALAARPGVVGFQLPRLSTEVLLLSPGDTLILATDGVHSGFDAGIDPDRDPQEIAESVLLRSAKGSDDAHVVVARYVGADA